MLKVTWKSVWNIQDQIRFLFSKQRNKQNTCRSVSVLGCEGKTGRIRKAIIFSNLGSQMFLTYPVAE